MAHSGAYGPSGACGAVMSEFPYPECADCDECAGRSCCPRAKGEAPPRPWRNRWIRRSSVPAGLCFGNRVLDGELDLTEKPLRASPDET